MSSLPTLQTFWAEIQREPSQFFGIMVTLIIIIVVRIWVRKYVLTRQPSQISGTLKAINVYPIKSCKGFSVTKWKISKTGLEHDREWMVIDAEGGRFQTQRQHPQMALITPSFKEENSNRFLFVDYPGMPTLKIQLTGNDSKPLRDVAVWDSDCVGADEGDEAASWFQKILNKDVRFVRVPPVNKRPTPPAFQVEKAPNLLNFNDAFPFLLISEASLADLNKRMAQTGGKSLPMNRFRPNLVVDGVPAYGEDHFKRFKIGDIVFFGMKKCTRCKVTTVDQNTGKFDGEEPLQTLRTFRKGLLKGGDEVCFGENLIHASLGYVEVGQQLVVYEKQ